MTKTQNGKSGSTRKVLIVGTVVNGRSGYSGWYGRCAGSESVIEEIGSEGDIDVYINSPGGSVFAGFEMVNAFNAARDAGREVTIYVSAMAASIASYIACGVKGAKVYMSSNAKMMFHAPWTFVLGSKDELRDTSNLLEKNGRRYCFRSRIERRNCRSRMVCGRTNQMVVFKRMLGY